MKDMLIISGMAIGAIIIGLILFSYGTNGTFHTVRNSEVPSALTSSSAVAVAVLAQGIRTPVDTRVNYLIESKSDLQKLWSTIYGKNVSTHPLPKVNFSKDQVLAVFAGTQPTGGYTISVSKVQDSLKKRTVTIMIISPAKSCTVTQKQTAPYEILTVPSTTLPLTHNDIQITHVCN